MKMYNASDDRDKVFALLSICSDGKHGDLKPDYNLPLVDMYTNVAAHIMSRDKISISLLTATTPTARLFPTWVPDWTANFVH
jgi:hypothetical protein